MDGTILYISFNIICILLYSNFFNSQSSKSCIILSTATNSLTVELLVLSLCLVNVEIGHPLPIVNLPPVCPLILGWTANDASTRQCSTLVLTAPSTSGNSRVALKYTIRCFNFHQLSTSGSLTLVVRNATAKAYPVYSS